MKSKQLIPLTSKSLIEFISKNFNTVDDQRGKNKVISIKDALMSAYAIFSLKIPSLLKFDEKFRKKNKVNLLSLFGVENIPSDTQTREIIDEVRPKNIQRLFPLLLKNIQRQKKLEAYEYIRINNRPFYLMPVDGSGYFQSTKLHGPCCQKKVHRNGVTKYYHCMLASAIVHPNLKTVIPMAPEGINFEDGGGKQDSEHKAFKRFFASFKIDHPKLNVIVCGDALYASSPIVRIIMDEGKTYILGVKEKSHNHLFNFVKLREERKIISEIKKEEITGDKVKKTVSKTFRFINGCPLNMKSSTELEVNFLEYIEQTSWVSNGQVKNENRRFTWVTNIRITEQNVEKIMQGGRARWKIENEVFNTLKNRLYKNICG